MVQRGYGERRAREAGGVPLDRDNEKKMKKKKKRTLHGCSQRAFSLISQGKGPRPLLLYLSRIPGNARVLHDFYLEPAHADRVLL